MARKVTITPEIILKNALDMVIEEGYQSLSVHSLAKKIGCSTQPIVWHFENMEGLRKALYVYALEYSGKKASSGSASSSDAFELIGSAYIKMAMKEPNLFKFLYLGEGPVSKPASLSEITKGNISDELITGISDETGLSHEQSVRVIRNTIVYSHGLATMIATGVYKASVKEVMAMINDASQAFVMKERRENA